MTCHNCAASCRKSGRNRNGTQRFRCPTCRKTFSEQRKTVGNMYLPMEKASQIAHLLVEGNSIRSVERITGVQKKTILVLLRNLGEGCSELLRQRVRAVPCRDLQLDEVWTYVGKKQLHLGPEDADMVLGDAYCFIAFERNTKLVHTWHLGKRDERNTADFITKVRDATTGTFQLSSDAFAPYRNAIAAGLHDRADYAQVIKLYGGLPGGRGEYYRPAKIRGTISASIMGNPDKRLVCTSHIERFNWSLRHFCKRLTRLTCAFSKKWDMLEAALAVHFAYYNFCRIHSATKVTPAIEAGVTDHVWSLDELLCAVA